jgi:nucleotide-binding universal stress UspA family protein
VRNHFQTEQPCWLLWSYVYAVKTYQVAGTSQGVLLPYSRILVLLDGSELAESVLLRAVSLASQMGASMTLLRSLDLPDLTVAGARQGGITVADMGVIVPTARQHTMQYLQQMQVRVQAHGIPTAVLVTEGGAAEDIARQAKTLGQAGNAVMVVMATHGRTGVGRWLYGSVAGAVLHLADVPLLVVRPR